MNGVLDVVTEVVEANDASYGGRPAIVLSQRARQRASRAMTYCATQRTFSWVRE